MKKLLVCVVLIAVLSLVLAGCSTPSGKATITVNVTPKSATVLIDEKELTAPVENLPLSKGTHKIYIWKEGYSPMEKEITINSSKHITLNIALEKARRQPTVLINTKEKFFIVLDKKCLWEFTGLPIIVSKGKHEIQLINNWGTLHRPYSLIGTFDIEKDTLLTEDDFKKEGPQCPEGLFFPEQFASSVPRIACCSAAATTYSGIYVNETVTLKGYTERAIKMFYLVFPSGKKIEINTTPGNCDECANYFEKTVTFDEPGYYKIEDKSNIPHESFAVYYKAIPSSDVIKVKDIFDTTLSHLPGDAIAVFEGETEKVKFLIKDANGKIMRNTPIGAYGLKTNENGTVTFVITGKSPSESSTDCCGELFVNGKHAPPFLIYGDVSASLVRRITINKKYAVKKDGDLYLPLESVVPCTRRMPKWTTINDKQYADITEIMKNKKEYPDTAIKETSDAYVIYGLIEMVP